VLRAHPWPGNVRELKNVLEQALHVKSGPIISRHDLPRSLVEAVEGDRAAEELQTLRHLLRQTEEEIIRKALRLSRGDKQLAASRLGISKSSMYAKIQELRIREPAP
jgi:transcriptional regulator with PAS, ATPase and Fis domain